MFRELASYVTSALLNQIKKIDMNDPAFERNSPICPDCYTEMETEYIDNYICPKCGYKLSSEPDYDSMPGGRDDY